MNVAAYQQQRSCCFKVRSHRMILSPSPDSRPMFLTRPCSLTLPSAAAHSLASQGQPAPPCRLPTTGIVLDLKWASAVAPFDDYTKAVLFSGDVPKKTADFMKKKTKKSLYFSPHTNKLPGAVAQTKTRKLGITGLAYCLFFFFYRLREVHQAQPTKKTVCRDHDQFFRPPNFAK